MGGARRGESSSFQMQSLPRSLSLLLLLTLVPAIPAQEWTRFRGPNGTGHAAVPMSFSGLSEKQVVWRKSLPGRGHSSPVAWGDRIILTAADRRAGTYTVLCVDARDSDILWRRDFPIGSFSIHRYNSLASSTAAVDEAMVYVSWGSGARLHLAALDHQGEPIWRRDLGVYRSQHGPGTSPILFENAVIMANEHQDRGHVIALDRKTGETLWKTPRGSAEKTAYSTPCLASDPSGNPMLLVNSQANGMGALDPRTGALLWQYPDAFDKRSCSSPLMAGGLVFGSCGSGGGGNYVVALRPPDGRERIRAEVAYEIRRSAPYVPTPLELGGRLFLWSDSGILSCVAPGTGEVYWSERLPGFGKYFGSPVAAGDEIVAVSDAGTIHVVSGKGGFRSLGRFDLDETCHATPAILGGHMYVRTVGTLWKFRPVTRKL